ncbi:hypothetical protein ADL27_58900, partial [Streptomyces sp. NRRL F-6602]
MTLFNTPRSRRRRLTVAAAAVGMLASLLTVGPAMAVPGPGDTPEVAERVSKSEAADTKEAISAGDIPGVDEIVHTENIKHLANIPKDALSGTNSDLAFQGKYAFAGNYDGFRVFDISNPKKPKTVSEVLCPCLLMKVFDISDKRKPRYVAAVETACGSHTHTLVPERKNVYVYVSSYSPSAAFPDCQPPHDGISVIKVPRKAPHQAAVIDFPVLFPGDGPYGGGNPGAPTNPGVSKTTGCHDITALPHKDLAAGACMGDGILLDIKNPEKPKVIDRVQDNENFAFWHSATFNQKADKVVFADELGGGGAATCNEEIGPKRGADGIYDLVRKGKDKTPKLVFRSYFKIDRHQADTENCVAHNGSIIPVKGRDIMV